MGLSKNIIINQSHTCHPGDDERCVCYCFLVLILHINFTQYLHDKMNHLYNKRTDFVARLRQNVLIAKLNIKEVNLLLSFSEMLCTLEVDVT